LTVYVRLCNFINLWTNLCYLNACLNECYFNECMKEGLKNQ